MANTNDSFIDEVTEALRSDRLAQWFRRWGWLVALVIVAIVGTAAFLEWRSSQAQAAAQLRGEAILTALETQEPAARLQALTELPTSGADGMVAAFLLAADQAQQDDAAAAVATLNGIAADGSVPAVYRDLASLKAQMILGKDADPTVLQALASPGAPYALLAQEQLALLDLQTDKRDEGIAALQAILADASVTSSQSQRVTALLTALGVPPEEAAADAPALPAAPAGE